MKYAFAACVLAGTLLSPSARADFFKYSPKLMASVSNGFIDGFSSGGDGTSSPGGSAFTFGGMNIGLAFFLHPRISVGFGYHADFNLPGKSLPLNGFTLLGRIYFYNEGTRVRSETALMSSETRDKFSFNAGLDLAQRGLFITNNATPITANFVQLNAAVGMDFHLMRELDLTAEINMTLFSFSTGTTEYNIGAKLLNIGLAYMW